MLQSTREGFQGTMTPPSHQMSTAWLTKKPEGKDHDASKVIHLGDDYGHFLLPMV